MDSMKSFTTAAREADAEGTEDEGLLSFNLDGYPLLAERPGDGQLAVLMADTGRHASRTQMVAGAIDFFHSTLAGDGASHIRNRLLDHTDDFGLAEVQEIMAWMIEEWTGVSFGSRSASTPSRRTAGSKSKRTTPALT